MIGRMLLDIAKDARSRALGRIEVYPGMYKFVEIAGPTPSDQVSDFAEQDMNGRDIVMRNGPGVFCPHPQWEGKAPKLDNGGRWKTPRYAVHYRRQCQKCEFHRKRRKGAYFPCCAFKATTASQHDAQRRGTEAAAAAFTDAVGFADRLMSGKEPLDED